MTIAFIQHMGEGHVLDPTYYQPSCSLFHTKAYAAGDAHLLQVNLYYNFDASNSPYGQLIGVTGGPSNWISGVSDQFNHFQWTKVYEYEPLTGGLSPRRVQALFLGIALQSFGGRGGTSVTVNFPNYNTRLAQMTLNAFSRDTAKLLLWQSPPITANINPGAQGAQPPSLAIVTPNRHHMLYRAEAITGNSADGALSTGWTKTATFTAALQAYALNSSSLSTTMGSGGEYKISTDTGGTSAPTNTNPANSYHNAMLVEFYENAAPTNNMWWWTF